MNGQPAVTGAFVHIDFHVQQFIEDVGGLAEDGVVQCAPALFSELIDDERFYFLNLDEFLFLDILRIILEDVEEGLLILLLDFLQHLLALGVQVLPHVELFLMLFFFLLVFLFLDCAHLRLCAMEAEYVVEVSFIDIHVFILFF